MLSIWLCAPLNKNVMKWNSPSSSEIRAAVGQEAEQAIHWSHGLVGWFPRCPRAIHCCSWWKATPQCKWHCGLQHYLLKCCEVSYRDVKGDTTEIKRDKLRVLQKQSQDIPSIASRLPGNLLQMQPLYVCDDVKSTSSLLKSFSDNLYSLWRSTTTHLFH